MAGAIDDDYADRAGPRMVTAVAATTPTPTLIATVTAAAPVSPATARKAVAAAKREPAAAQRAEATTLAKARAAAEALAEAKLNTLRVSTGKADKPAAGSIGHFTACVPATGGAAAFAARRRRCQ